MSVTKKMKVRLKGLKKVLLFTIILQASSPIYSQVIKEGLRVSMPLQLYRDVRNKCLMCDTLIDNYDSIIVVKDSIIKEHELKEQRYSDIINAKDTTIKALNFEIKSLTSRKEAKLWQRKETWLTLLIGFVVGVVVSR